VAENATSDDQFDDFATSRPEPFTLAELERLAQSRRRTGSFAPAAPGRCQVEPASTDPSA
jgi:hypothetical protein